MKCLAVIASCREAANTRARSGVVWQAGAHAVHTYTDRAVLARLPRDFRHLNVMTAESGGAIMEPGRTIWFEKHR